MNKGVKEIVYRLCEDDKEARENDKYLITKVFKFLEPYNVKDDYINIQNSKISMEGITRARRKWCEENADRVSKEVQAIRNNEEMEYREVYKHIPYIY